MRHAREDYNRIQDPEGEIPEDEPVFLLRGKDLAAPDAIRKWAEKASSVGASTEIVAKALEWAKVMEEYQSENKNWSTPDL